MAFKPAKLDQIGAIIHKLKKYTLYALSPYAFLWGGVRSG